MATLQTAGRLGSFGRPNSFASTQPDYSRASQLDLDGLKQVVDGVLVRQHQATVTVPPGVLSRITDLEVENQLKTQAPVDSKTYPFESYKFSSVESLEKGLGASIDTVDVGSYLDIVGALTFYIQV